MEKRCGVSNEGIDSFTADAFIFLNKLFPLWFYSDLL